MILQLKHGCVVAEGADAVAVFRILSLRGAMSLELRGLRHSGGRSVIAAVKREFGLRGNREAVYREFCEMHQLDPDTRRNPPVKTVHELNAVKQEGSER